MADGENPGDSTPNTIPQKRALTEAAKNMIYITKSCTIKSAAFSGNVVIDPGVVVTVDSNAAIVVNGDLWDLGELDISSANMTVNGDVLDYGILNAGGTSNIVVNKAASGGISGYYGGNFIVDNYPDYGYTGYLNVSGSASITVNYATDAEFAILDGAHFSMTSSAAKITVYDSCEFNGSSTQSGLSAGTFEIINGDFTQNNEFSDYSFSPSDDFQVIMKSTKSKSYTWFVTFNSPADSYFTNFEFVGINFDWASDISIKKDIDSDTTFNIPGANIDYQGNINGHRLTVNAGSLHVVGGAEVSLGGGSILSNCNFFIDNQAKIVMDDTNEKITVNGRFNIDGTQGIFTEGMLEVNGDFEAASNDQATFKPGPDFIVRIIGSNRDIHLANILTKYITNLDLAQGASINPNSMIALKSNLDTDWSFPCYVSYSGSFHGHTLHAARFAIAPDMTVDIDGGKLLVDKDFYIGGTLLMQNEDDFLSVGGDMTVTVNTELSAGKMYVKGNFFSNYNEFHASGSHTTILCGTGPQNIILDPPAFTSPTDNKFAKLIVLNDSLDLKQLLPSYYDSLVVTGTTLDHIDVSIGTLTPVPGQTNQLQLLLPYGTDSVNVTPVAPSQYSDVSFSYKVDGKDAANGDVSIVPRDGKNTLTFEIHAYEDYINPVSYTVIVEMINPDLGLLDFPDAAVCDQALSPATLAYTVQLPEAAGPFLWTPKPQNTDSKLTIWDGARNLGTSTTVSLAPGSSKVYTIRITAQDGITVKQYTVTFNHRSPISSIAITGGKLAPDFKASTTDYVVTVPTTSASVTVSITRDTTDCQDLKIGGAPQPNDSINLSLDPGDAVTVVVSAKDADGETSVEYKLNISRSLMITGISASPTPVSPTFDPGTTAYTVNIPATVSSVKITPAKSKTGVKAIYINNKKLTNITVSPKIGETIPVKIKALASDGKTYSPEYTVNVTRAPLVTGIGLDTGTLSPVFALTTLSYTVDLPADTASVTVMPTKAYDSLALTNSSPTLKPAPGGSATTTITATADKKTKSTYTVTSRRAPIIDGISVTGGTLSPAFNTGAYNYTVSLPAIASGVTISAMPDAVCSVLTVGGDNANSKRVNPEFGETIKVEVVGSTAGGASVTYTVTVTRAALVTKIAVGTKGVSLNQPFDPKEHNYTVSTTAASISFSVAKASKGVKSLTINGKKVSSFTAKPAIGGTVVVDVIATATDGSTTAEYKITVTRSAPLLNLTADAGTMAAFDPGILTYSLELPATTSSVTLTPTTNTSCTCTNDITKASGPVLLSHGIGESKTVKFTADSADKTNPIVYTVVVSRAAALTGDVANPKRRTSP